MNEDAKQKEEAVEAAPTPKKKSKLPLLLGILAVGGGGVGAFLGLRSSAKPVAPAPTAEAEAEAHAPANTGGQVVALSPFIVNLNDEDQVSYLKCTIAVEVEGKAAAAMVETKGTVIRNVVILYLSSLGVDDTRGTKKKEKILTELGVKIGEVIGKSNLLRVYLSEFVIQ